jgi:hypothetical protein
MKNQKEPLYRKENKTTICRKAVIATGGDFRHQRNTKKMKNFDGNKQSMKKKQLGYDYTPLFRFLLSKIGQAWDETHKEVIQRLDKSEPIFWMVSLNEHDRRDVVRIGEASSWSGLFVDEEGLLQKVNPEAKAPEPTCSCCTFSFNGNVTKKNPLL